MMSIKRGKDGIMYTKPFNIQAEKMNNAPSYIPPPFIPKVKDIITFNEWISRYGDDVDDIIDEYIVMFRDACLTHGYACSLNVDKIREKMYHLFYKTSFNRYKYFQDLIE